MTSNPSITLILTVRNRCELLGRTLRSITAQKDTDFDIIIVDNASTDAAPRIINRWADENRGLFRSVTIVNEPKTGAASARNCGLHLCTTDYVMYFDSDDEMTPDHIKRIREFLAQNPETELLRWDIGILDSDGWLQVKSLPGKCDAALQIIHSPLSTQRFIVTTQLLRSIGGWNEELTIWIDWELGCRLILTGTEAKYLTGEPTVIVHPSDNSITGSRWCDKAAGHRKAIDKVKKLIHNAHTEEKPSPETRRLLLIVDAKLAAAAGRYRREGDKTSAAEALRAACSGHSLRQRCALHTIYSTVLIAGCGLSPLCSLFFPEKKPKE